MREKSRDCIEEVCFDLPVLGVNNYSLELVQGGKSQTRPRLSYFVSSAQRANLKTLLKGSVVHISCDKSPNEGVASPRRVDHLIAAERPSRT